RGEDGDAAVELAKRQVAVCDHSLRRGRGAGKVGDQLAVARRRDLVQDHAAGGLDVEVAQKAAVTNQGWDRGDAWPALGAGRAASGIDPRGFAVLRDEID